MIKDLQKSPNPPSKDTISKYIRKVEFLKGLLETKNIPSSIEKAVATQLLTPVPDSVTKEIHQKTTSKYNKELREQLLGEKSDLRNRKGSSSGDDVDALLKYHHNVQEKIAENMLLMARSMKEQTMLAGNIIRKDIEVVEKSSNLAEKNFSHLNVESEKLQEHSRRAWKCWMWFMLAAVLVIFINMVMFMKIMKKKKL
uniref:Vesicle transport protein USE1 n=1 Tax=Clastoptera arizonana TaxID=38151 RepID=A0A1B6D1L4_9HEMI